MSWYWNEYGILFPPCLIYFVYFRAGFQMTDMQIVPSCLARGILTFTCICACPLGCYFVKFGIAIVGFSSEMKEPKLHKLSVFPGGVF